MCTPYFVSFSWCYSLIPLLFWMMSCAASVVMVGGWELLDELSAFVNSSPGEIWRSCWCFLHPYCRRYLDYFIYFSYSLLHFSLSSLVCRSMLYPNTFYVYYIKFLSSFCYPWHRFCLDPGLHFLNWPLKSCLMLQGLHCWSCACSLPVCILLCSSLHVYSQNLCFCNRPVFHHSSSLFSNHKHGILIGYLFVTDICIKQWFYHTRKNKGKPN